MQLNNKYTVTIPAEMYDFLVVLQDSADSGKYESDNWLKPDGNSIDNKSNYASIFRHVAEASTGSTQDKQSGRHPALHAACRLMMTYTRWKKGLIHPLDNCKGRRD